MFKCTNCSWEGEDAKQERFCPICGDNVILIKPKIVKEETIVKKVPIKVKSKSKKKK